VKKNRCTDSDLGGKVGLEIVFSIGAGREPRLTAEYRKHLEDCECCRESVPLWNEKGQATRRHSLAVRIVNLSRKGDPAILRRNTKEGLALFKPDEHDASKGLYVLLDADHNIFDPEGMNLEDFNRLE